MVWYRPTDWPTDLEIGHGEVGAGGGRAVRRVQGPDDPPRRQHLRPDDALLLGVRRGWEGGCVCERERERGGVEEM